MRPSHAAGGVRWYSSRVLSPPVNAWKYRYSLSHFELGVLEVSLPCILILFLIDHLPVSPPEPTKLIIAIALRYRMMGKVKKSLTGGIFFLPLLQFFTTFALAVSGFPFVFLVVLPRCLEPERPQVRVSSVRLNSWDKRPRERSYFTTDFASLPIMYLWFHSRRPGL